MDFFISQKELKSFSFLNLNRPMTKEPHTPVLLQEFLRFFEGRTIKRFVDCTLGAGGHAKALLDHHSEIESYIGIDQDLEALEIAKKTLHPYLEKAAFHHGNFRHLKSYLSTKVDAIFVDLGVSSMQLTQAEKGFSFMKDGPLDMRMDQTQRLTAAKIINTYSEKELAHIFWEFGEEPRSRQAAKAIVEARRRKKIVTTMQLCEILKPVLTWSGRSRKKIHPMTLIFQGLRIKVNDELKVIEEVIAASLDVLDCGGRLGMISFQSLEDRIVKETFKKIDKEKVLILTKKPIQATVEEIKINPRARSAKMRFLEVIS